jgi:hypothetical protein
MVGQQRLDFGEESLRRSVGLHEQHRGSVVRKGLGIEYLLAATA